MKQKNSFQFFFEYPYRLITFIDSMQIGGRNKKPGLPFEGQFSQIWPILKLFVRKKLFSHFFMLKKKNSNF